VSWNADTPSQCGKAAPRECFRGPTPRTALTEARGRAHGPRQTRHGSVLFCATCRLLMSNTAADATATTPELSLPTTAIVPAAGFGPRLRPLTDAIPKEMLPVGRRLALEHIVDELRAAGMTTVVFVLSPAKEAFIKKHFGEGADGVAFRYAIQPEMRG